MLLRVAPGRRGNLRPWGGVRPLSSILLLYHIQQGFSESVPCVRPSSWLWRHNSEQIPTLVEPVSLEEDSARNMINNCHRLLSGDKC